MAKDHKKYVFFSAPFPYTEDANGAFNTLALSQEAVMTLMRRVMLILKLLLMLILALMSGVMLMLMTGRV